ncbi:hypothetical protein [Gilvimarinus sp. 1_MG-2023]|uniref:hypothetical protein n=1 Tax=Gilvimarinus sp. 1_MG-2023 TaxID=3062638 RepID=UPI0026E283C8|nr:hypothetical protein [Gilvimarinus sp. 1_MG-2023]MDO6747223.1 hypothetical protein [Gilvimarinus sp. 1_MG-2023]
MKRIERKKLMSEKVLRANGSPDVLHVYQQVHVSESLDGPPERMNGFKERFLSNGEWVNPPNEKGELRTVAGELLTAV